MDRHESGRKGGLATRAKHGASHFHNIGKLGGRPPLPILASPGTPREINNKRGLPPTGYTSLLNLWESHSLNCRGV